KWLAIDYVGRRDDNKLTRSLKYIEEFSPIGRDAKSGYFMGRQEDKVDDVEFSL
ncbi:hypothetical protein KI387_007724, partial [Taxus chinensis]